MNDISEFIAQIPPMLYIMACAPALLLAAYILVRVGLRQRQQGSKLAQEGTQALNALRAVRSAAPNPDDLPDLDLLLSPVAPAGQAKGGVRVLAETPQRVRLADGSLTSAQEVLSILRDSRDGRLMVQMGETAYRSLAEAPDAKREFTRLMKELSSLIMQADDNPPLASASPAPEAPAPVRSATGDARRSSQTKILAEPVTDAASANASLGDLLSAPPVQPATPAPKVAPPAPEVPKGTLPGDLPSYSFDDNPAFIQKGRFGVKKVEFEPPPNVDIPTAIDSYLQWKIAQTPEMQGRGIAIRPSISGGVTIMAEGTRYEFVDEVPNPEVRRFIQIAIAEWQARN